MKLLTSLAAAFAAGTISFAAVAEPQAPVSKQYLFSSTATASAQPGKTKAVTGKKSVKRHVVKAKAGKHRRTGKRIAQKKAPRQRSTIDVTTTASVPVRLERGMPAVTPYHGLIRQYASTNGVPVSLAHAVITVESNFRVDAKGSAGEIGLMQLKPATARMMGYRGPTHGLFDPETNIKYGMKYLGMAHKLGGGATCTTILKYNAGHAARRMNPVSAAYCGKVMSQIGG